VKNNSLPVELLIDEDIEVVFFLLNIDWDVNTHSFHREWNRFSVVLVLKENSEFLEATCQLIWDEGKLNLSLRVSLNFRRSLELYLGEKLFILNLSWSKCCYLSVYIFHRVLFLMHFLRFRC
jgi:hypothetical protein